MAYEWRGFQAGADPTRTNIDFEEEGQFGALLGRAFLTAAGAGRITTGTAGAGGEVSQVLLRSPRSLQKFFTKHGADFGLSGNWNPGRAADASRAIHQHINSAGVRAIRGTYRGDAVIHYLDPNTGLNVIADPAGNFISGWRLGPEQVTSVLTSGRLF